MALGFLQEEKKTKRRIRHHIEDALKDSKLTYEDMATLLDLKSKQAFFYKLSNMTFNAYELKKIFTILKFSDSEILLLMKGD